MFDDDDDIFEFLSFDHIKKNTGGGCLSVILVCIAIPVSIVLMIVFL